MSSYQHHTGVGQDYPQDYINGITDKEYDALFQELADIKSKKENIRLIEIGGGTGNLALQLQEKDFDILLTDLDVTPHKTEQRYPHNTHTEPRFFDRIRV